MGDRELTEPVHEFTRATVGEVLVGLGIWMDRFSVGKNAMEVLLQLIRSKLLGELSHNFPSTLHQFNSALGLHGGSFSDYVEMFCPINGCNFKFKCLPREEWAENQHQTCPHHPECGFRFLQGCDDLTPSWGALFPPMEKYLQAQFSSQRARNSKSLFFNKYITSLRMPQRNMDGEVSDWYDSAHARKTAQALTMQNPLLSSEIFQPSTHFIRLAGDDVSPDVKKVSTVLRNNSTSSITIHLLPFAVLLLWLMTHQIEEEPWVCGLSRHILSE